MTVHVGIVLYNSAKDLPACITALQAQTYPSLRFYAVDNASQDEGCTWLQAHMPDSVILANKENRGFGAAHNQLLRWLKETGTLAATDYYLALNPDALLAPDYVARVVAQMETDPRTGWASGKLVQAERKQIYSAGHALFRNGYAINIGYGVADKGQFEDSCEVFGVPGASVVMKAAFIEDLWLENGLYDEAFFLSGEDTDVDWRGQLRGWHCWYIAQATAEHHGGQAATDRAVDAVVNRYLSVIKNACWRDLITYNLPLITIHLLMRLVMTPRLGARMLRHFLSDFRRMWRQRREASCTERMQMWFRWAADQPTAQPRSFRERWFAWRGSTV